MKSSVSVKSTVISKKRAGLIDDVEELLVTWMEDQLQNYIPLNILTIQAKTRSLFIVIKWHADDPIYTQMVTASHGWFCFKWRHNFLNIKVNDEVARADTESAEGVLEELHMIIVGEV